MRFSNQNQMGLLFDIYRAYDDRTKFTFFTQDVCFSASQVQFTIYDSSLDRQKSVSDIHTNDVQKHEKTF